MLKMVLKCAVVGAVLGIAMFLVGVITRIDISNFEWTIGPIAYFAAKKFV